ncbi:hypothetical protein [Mucilaginibacter terrae]|uniref:Uncharacterized protein n=1 Tax=Mucilaginibacter terrae TaxID=1955052 RepID=A0ABU3GSE5_9SPHI|nr:hypothetical protein [Mucilaginibacter terrae]MDT3402506.1 hypothetical protein [Mucilaginibacter terrae]
MYTSKIIRHRHKFHHYLNDDLKEVKEETHFKIVFSDPAEFDLFREWIKQHEGRVQLQQRRKPPGGYFS